MKEIYVKYRTAVLLKNAGFKEKCDAYYNSWKQFTPSDEIDNFNRGKFITFSAPRLSFVRDWLLKKHDLYIKVDYDDLNWNWNAISVSEDVPVEQRPLVLYHGDAGWKSFDEALEKGVVYALKNLI